VIPALTDTQLARVRDFEAFALSRPQLPVTTRHCFHAGIYSRSLMMHAGEIICGALIKIDTVVIVSGDCSVVTGGGAERVTGYHVIPAAAGRKQIFYAHADTWLTMQFATAETTIEAAEAQFTDEADRLASRYNQNVLD
jgi:hypothetical protein